MIGSEEQEFLVAGEVVRLSPDQVLAATKSQRPDRGGVKPGTWYVVLRKRKVPAKWALRQTLGLPGGDFQTNQSVAILRRLGFECDQEPHPMKESTQ